MVASSCGLIVALGGRGPCGHCCIHPSLSCARPPGGLGWGLAGRPRPPFLLQGVLVTSDGCQAQCDWVHFPHSLKVTEFPMGQNCSHTLKKPTPSPMRVRPAGFPVGLCRSVSARPGHGRSVALGAAGGRGMSMRVVTAGDRSHGLCDSRVSQVPGL